MDSGMTRRCRTPGCGEPALAYSALGIQCQLAGKPEPPKKFGRPPGYTGLAKNNPYANRHYHRLRERGYSAQCASHKHKCLLCSCQCHQEVGAA